MIVDEVRGLLSEKFKSWTTPFQIKKALDERGFAFGADPLAEISQAFLELQQAGELEIRGADIQRQLVVR